ncbi:MAG: PhoH family protein [Lachnospiraceae bacterium]|jgi:phosphate starvation-inducible PhoH-like protein
MSRIEKIIDVSECQEKKIFGEFDSYLRIIEKAFDVTVIERDGKMKIIGEEAGIDNCESVIRQLSQLAASDTQITDQTVNYAISLAMENDHSSLSDLDSNIVCRTVLGKPVKPKTLGQEKYINNMKERMIVFGIGPAGTGKTYLAMAMAINAFKKDEVSRIILTRPAIEAGEKLGFLPGDLQSKVDPYLRPLYDALYQIMGAESFMRNMEKGAIEVAPLAYMRGRTLDNAYIILDEAQNTTPAQMKMFLTRIGYGSKVVITGDLTQKDLSYGAVSGLEHAIKVLKGVDEIGYSYLTSKDVVRHPLVQKIVKAYDDYEAKSNARNHRKRS